MPKKTTVDQVTRETTWKRERPACGASESWLQAGVKLIFNDVAHASEMFCYRQMVHMETMNWLHVQGCNEPKQHFHVFCF